MATTSVKKVATLRARPLKARSIVARCSFGTTKLHASRLDSGFSDLVQAIDNHEIGSTLIGGYWTTVIEAVSEQINYHTLSVLVADDFSGFRNTVNGILQRLGVNQITLVGHAEEVLEHCRRRQFDLVLCDYNLGRGRTGQHVLEELRFTGVLTYQTLFVMVSAEANRNVVMCVYDSQPDDYLMKPITGRALHTRIERLLQTREAFRPVNEALAAGDSGSAMKLLAHMAHPEKRYAGTAQKMLGELYINEGELDRAEQLYQSVLEIRQLDWARLGLARVKQARGELDVANRWLERIVKDSPLFLPAYDVLARNWEERGERENVQSAVQRAVNISPMSILRQKQLSEVARQNNDLETAIQAVRRTVKLGELSCHGNAENHFNLARAVSLCLEQKLDIGPSAVGEAISVLNQAKERFRLTDGQSAQRELLTGRMHALEGQWDLARQYVTSAEAIMDSSPTTIEAGMDYAAALKSIGENRKADLVLQGLEKLFGKDQQSLEKLDLMLDEPASEANKKIVAKINQQGINAYEAGKFNKALACFEKARKLFPRHVGIHLNIIQTLIGKARAGQASEQEKNECFVSLRLVAGIINHEHPQYERFEQLKKMTDVLSGKI